MMSNSPFDESSPTAELFLPHGTLAMTKKQAKSQTISQEACHYHKDGSLWATGLMTDGVMDGYWEWFRKDGTKLRSGHFQNGEQVGQWVTYDRTGKEYKVTNMKPKVK